MVMSKDLSLPEVYADAFVGRFGMDCGLRLDEIAQDIGLQVQEVEAEGFDGALIRVRGRALGTVALNARIRESGRRRFTLAHENRALCTPKTRRI